MHFSTPHQWLRLVHLLYPYLTMLVAKPFPKRSAPWLFTKAPLGGLKPSPARQLRWVGCSFATSTISITACNECLLPFIASRHTMCSAGLKVRNFQLRTEPIRLFNISNFPSIVKDELAVLQQRAAVQKTAETRITYDTLLSAAIYLILSLLMKISTVS